MISFSRKWENAKDEALYTIVSIWPGKYRVHVIVNYMKNTQGGKNVNFNYHF